MKSKLVIAALLACAAKKPQDIDQPEGETDTSGAGSDPVETAAISPAELDHLREASAGLEKLGIVILDLFPDLQVADGETISTIAEKLIRAHAAKPDAAAPEPVLVEGCSAIHKGADGKGVASVYVIGVSAEKGIACIYGSPHRLIQLKELSPVKRGQPISASEVAQRSTAFPKIEWDARTGD